MSGHIPAGLGQSLVVRSQSFVIRHQFSLQIEDTIGAKPTHADHTSNCLHLEVPRWRARLKLPRPNLG
jgi:hypothetical protein